MADFLFLALTGKKPIEAEARPLQILIGLLISNGPGAISSQGAKGAVSADGPQTPGRVQINKAMIGCLTHSGYSHGGNGFEGMAFLLEQFKDATLKDPTDRNHGIDLKAMATRGQWSHPSWGLMRGVRPNSPQTSTVTSLSRPRWCKSSTRAVMAWSKMGKSSRSREKMSFLGPPCQSHLL